MAETSGRKNMERARFQRVMEKYSPKSSKEKYDDQKTLSTRLEELKREPFRIKAESSGLPKTGMRGHQHLETVFSLGEVWKSTNSHNIPLSSLLEDVRKKGNKERHEFIVKRMGTLTGNEQEELINYVRTNISGLMTAHDVKPKNVFKPPMDREPFISLFDFPGRHSSRPFVPIRNFINSSKENDSGKEKIKLTPGVSTILGFPNKKTYDRLYEMFKKNDDSSLKKNENPSLGYCIVGDCHRAVRNYLRTIGWHEKFCSPEERTILTKALQRPGNDKDVTNLFREHPVKFIWVNGYLNWTPVRQGVIVSRIPSSNAYFSKMSLSLSLKDLHPFVYDRGEIDAKLPRTYEMRSENDMKHFAKHFRMNACICMLKKYVEMFEDKHILDVDGSVPLDSVDFAVKRVVELIRYTEHADLENWHFSVVSDDEWDVFLLRFHDIVHFDSKFQTKNSGINTARLYTVCQRLLDAVYKYFPEMKYEGTKNLWICKPSNGSCGRGVRVLRKLEEIRNNCKSTNFYVIQKYIERPFLIYNTKFDIRQWFLITSVSPLVIWMYNECYLRFCSQEFTLKNLHESVHLCNNTIQWKYKNGVRSPKLPNDNMWDNSTFADFLRKELKMDQWFNIQDQMRQAIIAACIATQDKMFNRANSFHLYGADFMLTPDFQVWLIEINCQPSMKYSTTVTSRMCKEVLEDTIKVGLERALNPLAPVGKFREIYRQSPQAPLPVLPFARKLQSRQKKKLPRKPYPFIISGHTTNKSSSRKWISYEEIANYKRHSMLSVKLDVKTDQPLDPGDSTAIGVTNSSVIINENPASSEKVAEGSSKMSEQNIEKGIDPKKVDVKKRAPNNVPAQNKSMENTSQDEKKGNSDDNKDEKNISQAKINHNKEKSKDIGSSKRVNENSHLEKLAVVMIPEETIGQGKKKNEDNAPGIPQTQNNLITSGDRIVTKEELLEANAGQFFKEAAEFKKALLRKKYIKLKPTVQKSKIGRVQSVKLSQNEQGDNKDLDKKSITNENSRNKKLKENVEDKSFTDISKAENSFYYEDNKSENNIEAILNKATDDSNPIKNLYLQALQENVIDLKEKSQISSNSDLLFDIIQGEENELWREFSGYTIIGESATDRELESVLNSPKYLNAIGKNGTKISPIYKGIVYRRRECCE